ncbi:helix-turn-helix domain-containing protein [Streptomyces sp. NPDC015127]|uniref:helix-turn-helix domain-containing protein n=1 Tax=Streptomyces sp. NPDC015127 TaxID=3364939 RepID=UPI0036F82258
MQAVELFEQKIKPPEVARCLRVSRKSAYQWHQLWRDGGVACRLWPAHGPSGPRCRLSRIAWGSWPCIWSRARPRTAGWRTRCGPPRGWPC